MPLSKWVPPSMTQCRIRVFGIIDLTSEHGRQYFRQVVVRPDGIAVPDCSNHPGDISEALNNPPAGGLLSDVEKHASEPPAPVYPH